MSSVHETLTFCALRAPRSLPGSPLPPPLLFPLLRRTVVTDVVVGAGVGDVVSKPTVAVGPSTLMGITRDAITHGRLTSRGRSVVFHSVREKG